ncbi:MAG TPA: hypothetical protein VES68_03080 [Candidatus Sulfotelmatobacter sp.]|nr:hypothetical protein [Candidatus Sulfotelmatobacter sp.]
MNENEGKVSKNFFVRTIENNKTLKYSGLTTGAVALLEILAKGNSFSADEQTRVIAIGVLAVVIGAIGSIMDMPRNS